MMETKLFEVIDKGTTMVCIGIKMSPAHHVEDRLLHHAGYGPGPTCILFGNATGEDMTFDPHDHDRKARTVGLAHEYVIPHWDGLPSGSVIDVEFIIGESHFPRPSEILR